MCMWLGVSSGSYAYTADLLTLSGRRSESPLATMSGWSHIECPMPVDVDLSFPRGCSVNDSIEPEVCSLHYTLVDETCKRVVAKGCGMVLAKFDAQGAFRTIPVHLNDRRLLGLWGRIYVDKVLPFWLRSAPKLYNAVADALLWILEKSDGVDGLHYLSPRFSAMQRVLARCTFLGVPVASRKTEGPSILGIEMNTLSLTHRSWSASGER